jgi:hypothetical protein
MSPQKIKIIGLRSIYGVPAYVPGCTQQYWNRDFDLEIFDPQKTYDPAKDLVLVEQDDTDDWYRPLKDRGFRVIRSRLWDQFVDCQATKIDGELQLSARDWIWLHEASLHEKLGYNYLRADAEPDRFFLMLMNLARDHRDDLWNRTQRFLSHSLYSYVERGVYIYDDWGTPNQNKVGAEDQHYYNPGWYARTCFSLAVESFADRDLFVSEKCFKPLALQHAFVVYGTAHTIRYLRSLGFESFDHVIDESYDSMENSDKEYLPGSARRDRMLEVVEDLYQAYLKGNIPFRDPESRGRIQHNYHRFYDKTALEGIWQKQISDVIKEFAHA